MKTFLTAALTALLFIAGAHAQPATSGAGLSVTGPVGLPAGQTMGGVTTANLVCDGATDNAALLAALLTSAAASNGTIYIPPAKLACMFASSVTVPDGVGIIAWPGSVVLKAKTGNVSSPLLLSFSGAVIGNNIYGITEDGGGTGFANTNNVNTVFNSNNVIFDHVTIQNTAGIGALFSTTVTNSGVRDSIFSNVGASYNATFTGTISGTTLTFPSNTGTVFIGQGIGGAGVVAGTSIVSGSGLSWVVSISQSVGPVAMTASLERQGIAFCCGVNLDTGGGLSPTTSSISGTTMTTGNSVAGIVGMYVYSNSTGSLPDTKVVSGSGTSWVVSQSQTVSGAHLVAANNSGNFVKNNSNISNCGIDCVSYTQQRNFAAENNFITSPGIGGAGIYDHSNDTSTVVGNIIFGTPTSGNGIDQAATFHTVITGNSSKNNGGSGIAYGYASHGVISGNISNNNGQNGLTGEGTSVAGLFLTGTTSPITSVVVTGNDFSDVQTTPTQQFGIEMQTASTFSNIQIDANNNMIGNVVSPYSSLLTPLPSNFTNTTVPSASSGFSATVTMPVASPGVVTWTAHNLKCLAPVYFSTSGALPTGLTAFVPVYVTCGASLTTNTFQVSSTLANALAGTSINFTGAPSGTQTGHYQVIPSSGAALDVLGLSLPAGNYVCSAVVIPYYGGATSVTIAAAWIGTAGGSALPYSSGTYATNVAGLTDGLVSWNSAAIVTPQMSLTTPPVRISLTAAGMAVLSYQATYTVSSETLSASMTCIPSR